jgi:hypothetical protein
VPQPEPVGAVVAGKRLEADEQLTGELRLAHHYRISHSQFLGGPARWTDVDRAKAAAYDEWHQKFCGSCGVDPDWFDPEKGGHRFAMIAEVERCPGCELKEQLREQLPKEWKGVHIKLVPNPELFPTLDEDDERVSDVG